MRTKVAQAVPMLPICGQSLVIRADASAKVGTGHAMRCLALAQAWQDAGGHATFMMAARAHALEERLNSEGMELIPISAQPGSSDDADQTVDLAQKLGASWVVVDGYHFGAGYQRFVKEAGLQLLFIDDNGHADRYYADIVLNQNLHAHEGLYANRDGYTRLLLGTRYVLLRREFWRWQGLRREIAEVARRVLVTLGGGDIGTVTIKIIEALQHVNVDGLDTMVLSGATNPHDEALRSAIRSSLFPIRLVENATNMSELMAWADIGVSAAGTTCWELAFMGLPSLLLVHANNQLPTAERLDSVGAAVNLGRPSDCSTTDMALAVTRLLETAETRREMCCHSQTLVDGQGASRILRHMHDNLPSLRHVREEDSNLLWEWINDPEVRRVSFSPDPVPRDKHVEWFRGKVDNPACAFYIATNTANIPVGQIRYDLKGDQAVVSVSVNRDLRAKGYGSQLIWLSAQQLFDTKPIETIHAYVKPANEVSIRAFEKVGYRNVGMVTMKGQDAVHLTLSRSGKDVS